MIARARSRGTVRGEEIGIGRELSRFARTFNTFLNRFLCLQFRNPALRRQVFYGLRLSGTRERAYFVKLSAELCDIEWRRALPLALAAECFIASAFTSDDIMDHAEMRWGNLAVWKRWGGEQAWLTAELLHGAGQIALDSVQPAVVASVMRNAFLSVIGGQAAQISAERICSTREVVALARKRTGVLIEVCFICPCLLSKSPLLKPLRTVGRNMGVAYQLADDVLDFIGDPVQMRKPILHDLLNGQPNIVVAHALRGRPSRERRLLGRWFGEGIQNHPVNVAPIIEAAEKCGSITYGRKLVQLYLNRASKGLLELPNGKATRSLQQFLNLSTILP